MNQINILEFDEISALGFFNINLNLVVSVSTYLLLYYTNHIFLLSFEYKNFPMILFIIRLC